MSLTRVKPSGWVTNEKLTAAQITNIDINNTYTLDKRAGQSDTLASNVSVLSGASIDLKSGSSLVTQIGSSSAINGSLNLNGTVTCSGNNIILTNSIISGNASVNLGIITGSTISMASGSIFLNSGSMFLQGNTFLQGTNSISGSTYVSGATTIDNFTMTSTNRVKLTSRSVTRTINSTFKPTSGNSDWSLNFDALGSAKTLVNTVCFGVFPLSIPDGVVLNTIKVYFEGGPGHVGAPNILPYAALYLKQPSSGGSGSLIASQYAVFTSIANYELVSVITISSIGYTVNKNNTKLAIQFVSESGANALAGLKVHGCEVTYTTTSMDDGPCN